MVRTGIVAMRRGSKSTSIARAVDSVSAQVADDDAQQSV